MHLDLVRDVRFVEVGARKCPERLGLLLGGSGEHLAERTVDQETAVDSPFVAEAAKA